LKNNLKISFAGDLSLSGIFHEKILKNKEIFDAALLNQIKSVDYFVCNFEGAATNKQNLIKKGIVVKSPPNSIEYLKSRSINIFNLANNHIFDCGLEGFVDTKSSIDNLGLFSFGAGMNITEASKILYLKKDNLTISLIGIAQHEGFTADQKSEGVFSEKYFEKLKHNIHEANQKSDWVVVNYHGMEEYTLYPSPQKRKRLKRIANIDGVNIVISHHSHTFQGIEKIGKTEIYYSLGNFVFDVECHNLYKYTDMGAIVNFEFDKSAYNSNLFPIKINKSNGIIETGGGQFLDHIKKLSDFSDYKSKWNKDAYRTIFERKSPINNKQNKQESLRTKSIFIMLFDPHFYKRLLKVMMNINVISIYTGALKYKLFKSKQPKDTKNL
jgi:poly-gamma-glutamate synthesis protein (capsule biosynthesis protein)